MKKKALVLLSLFAAGTVLFLSECQNNQGTGTAPGGTIYASVHLPPDALPSCTVPQDSFNTWFASGKPSENGLVTPANSVTFGHQNNCDFYQWSERMFLWLTSPAGGAYGAGGTVMASPAFYTVAADSSGSLQLIKHEPGQIIKANSNIKKTGPNRLPLFKDKAGHLLEIKFHKPGEKVMVKNKAGQTVELGPVEKNANGTIVLKDKNGKELEKPMFATHFKHPEKIIHAFKTAAGTLFLDSNGNEIDTELSQATGDVLMSQNGSLVYYITMVNDVYAYFLSAVKDSAMAGNTFPTTVGARDSILAYARKNGYAPAPDSNALALELKTSWILADGLSNISSFVTMDAIVPTYDTSNSKQWIPNGQKKVKLALVGVHIVGSVAGHPEMIWATFEHASNTPNASYQYLTKSNQVQTIAADTGNYVFASNGARAYNVSHMTAFSGDTITADSGYSISPSNTQRTFPFGAGSAVPNQQDTSASASNTEVIAINNSIMSMLVGNDVRKNYLFIGATWTFGGAPPTGNVYSVTTVPGSAIGTSLLANSTMETYFQGDTTTCFTCHSGNPASLQPEALSHIFQNINPLPASVNTGMNKK